MKSLFLSPFSRIYGAIVNLRRKFYKNGVFRSIELGVRTISVGNITVGGTGKTPLTAFIADVLAGEGEKVCILTRGYGRDNPKERILVTDGQRILADAREAGDEPFELADKLLGKAIIIADANRAEAGKWAQKEFGITVFILDDGFQHLPLQRHLDIVLLDAANPFGNRQLLPAGILRESVASLRYADAVVITRANLVGDISEVKDLVSRINPKCQLFISKNRFRNAVKLQEFLQKKRHTNNEIIKNLNCLAFCALGNPDNFFAQLRQENFHLVSGKAFSDHHLYTRRDVRKLEEIALEKGAEILLTTAKDAVKLTHLKFNFPCYVMENGLIFENESAFLDLIKNNRA